MDAATSTMVDAVVPIRVLGTVEVTGPAGPAKLLGGRQPALLGLLAIAAPGLLPVSRLVAGLWGDQPPRTAIKTLHSHVARVRQALDGCGLPGILRTREPGYLLTINPEDIDAHRFEGAARTAREELAQGHTHQGVRRLRAALDLWRGDALANTKPLGWAAAEARRLDELRRTALGDMWAGELDLGRHELAVHGLERLLVEHPHDERLVRLTMLALYRCGRHNEALAVFARLRAYLADELGSEPDPELARLHVRILRRDPELEAPAGGGLPAYPDNDGLVIVGSGAAGGHPPGSGGAGGPPSGSGAAGGPPVLDVPLIRDVPRLVPAELPGPVGHFTGRAEELRALDEGAADPDIRVLLICGAAGMGKTSLAVSWGRRVADRFPDGQIFCDLRGQDPTPAGPGEALTHVLTAVDGPEAAARLPESGRLGRYRSLSGQRRVLVLADNASSVEQVLALVPAGSSALLVVTSRSRLAGLATHHPVRVVELGALRLDEALTLLGRVVGPDRVANDHAGATRLVNLCDRMPLALQIAAAKLVTRPRRGLSDLADALSTDQRLDELTVAGDARSVRAVFASAYHALSPPSARMFRLLGLHPGRTISGWLAAALIGLPMATARPALDELAAAHLIDEVDDNRFAFHDLIRWYANECARLAESSPVRARAVDRLLDWYLAVADAANQAIDTGRDRVVPQLRYRPEMLPFSDEPHQALAFLDGERDNLLSVVDFAGTHRRPSAAWQLTYLVTGFFDSRGHWADRVELCRYGVAAAKHAGDRAAEGLMRSGLGVAYLTIRQFDRALGELRRALALMREHGDLRGEAHVYNNIAVAYSGMRRYGAAIVAYRRALESHTAQGSALGVALCLNNLGDAHVRMGRPDLAIDLLNQARSASQAIGNTRLSAAAESGLGQAYRDMGEWATAVRHFERALTLRRRAGDRRYEADTLRNLGLIEVARGRDASARRFFTDACALARQAADPHQEAAALTELGRIHMRESDWAGAAQTLRHALAMRELAPDPHEASRIRRDLAEVARRTGARAGPPDQPHDGLVSPITAATPAAGW